MRKLLQVFFLLLGCLLLAAFALAEELPAEGYAEQQILDTTAALERDWENRLGQDSTSFTFLLIDCGETVLAQSSQSCLDVSYCFETTDWSSFQTVCCSTEDHGSKTVGFDPFGDQAVLRARCFLYVENGETLVCQTVSITGKNGVLLSRSIQTKPLTQEPYVLRFETFPAEQAAAPDLHEMDNPLQGSGIQTSKQRWTYVSSDERPLWRVELRGAFQDGLCLNASADVEALDGAWQCELVSCDAEGANAVAVINVRRYALGIPVAQEQLQFRIAPP